METWVWIVIAAVVAAALILVVAIASARSKKRQRDHSDHLQERFGPEYERTVSAEGRKDGERRLSTVEQEHDELDIKPLSPEARER